MIVLAYLGVSAQNFMQQGGCVDILHPFIWGRESGLNDFQDAFKRWQ
jgi:hypothetical protein